MSDIGRIPAPGASGDATSHVPTVNPDSRGQRDGQQSHAQQQETSRRGSEELALALSEEGHASVEARIEQDESGATVIRIVDRESGESVAVVTPEELRELAEQTGLPTGMLLQAQS